VPAANEETQEPICSKHSALEVCEFAFREVTQAPLHLADEEFDRDALAGHLKGCAACTRWYRNALRTYQRLKLEGKLPSRNEPPVERPAVRQKQAASSLGFHVYRVEPRGAGLNALVLTLTCRQTSLVSPANPRGWEGTLKYLSRAVDPAGNDPDLLRPYDEHLVTLRIRPGEGEPIIRQTRLGLDDSGNLVSTPCPLAEIDPEAIAAVSLLSWKKAGQL
jgi:hypothetical protein